MRSHTPGTRRCSIRHEVGRSDWEKEAADDSKCEAELVDVADTLEACHL